MQQVLPGGAMCDLVVVNLPTVQDTNYVLFRKMSWKIIFALIMYPKFTFTLHFNSFFLIVFLGTNHLPTPNTPRITGCLKFVFSKCVLAF